MFRPKISLDSRRHEFIKFNRYMTLREYDEYIGSDVYNYITFDNDICKLHLEVCVFYEDDLKSMIYEGCDVSIKGDGPFEIEITLNGDGYLGIDHLTWKWERKVESDEEITWHITNPYTTVVYERGMFNEMVSEEEKEEFENFLTTDTGKHITYTSKEMFQDVYYRQINFFKAMSMFLRRAN